MKESKERIEFSFCNFPERPSADENPMNTIIYHGSKPNSGRILGKGKVQGIPLKQKAQQTEEATFTSPEDKSGARELGRGRVKVQRPLRAVLCICLILSLFLLPACREGCKEEAAMQKHYSYVTERGIKIHTQLFLILKMPTGLVPCSLLLS